MKIAMIPARMGSQRLKQKNLREIDGVSIIARAIRRCREAGSFDEIWVNSEHDTFGEIAIREGVLFHKRPEALANNTATSEQFVYEFLQKHPCEHIFQVHSIAPLLKSSRIREFAEAMIQNDYDVLLSCVCDQIECAYQGKPVNFSFSEKTNSQDLKPVQRITWGITGWRSETFMAAHEAGKTATYAGKIGFLEVSPFEGHVIKTEEDFKIACALLSIL